MTNRGKARLLFAITITIPILIGLVLIGVNADWNASDAMAPLVSASDASQPSPTPADVPGTRIPVENAAVTQTVAVVYPTIAPPAKPTATATLSLGPIHRNTPTPVQVVVSTQKRSWVYYHGPATYVRADAFAPLPLASLPRPTGDNGRGLDWFPTTFQTRAVVDRFIPELAAMKIRWLVVLQGMNDWDLVANDYLIQRLMAEGITPIMRIDRQVGPMDWQRLGWIIARNRERGVHYFQIYNEPNVDDEWGVETLHSPERYVAYWIQAAEVVAANGGLPGFAPVSPQKDDSDLVFFQAALQELKRLGRFDLANLMWVSVHNYGGFDRANPTDDGFFRYRSYDAIVRKVFGGSLPMISTEGGTGEAEQMANVSAPMFSFGATEREPYLFAFAPWLIGNAVGGGHDPRWENAAWFAGTLSQVYPHNVVEQAKQ